MGRTVVDQGAYLGGASRCSPAASLIRPRERAGRGLAWWRGVAALVLFAPRTHCCARPGSRISVGKVTEIGSKDMYVGVGPGTDRAGTRRPAPTDRLSLVCLVIVVMM